MVHVAVYRLLPPLTSMIAKHKGILIRSKSNNSKLYAIARTRVLVFLSRRGEFLSVG